MLLLATMLIAGLALMASAYASARRGPRIAAGTSALLCALLVARSVLAARADWEWSLFPWPAYAFVQGLTLYVLAAAFFAVAAATMRVRWNRAVVLLVGLAVLAHGVWPTRGSRGPRPTATIAWRVPTTTCDSRVRTRAAQRLALRRCPTAACARPNANSQPRASRVAMARDCSISTAAS